MRLDLTRLPTWASPGVAHVVVEAPRGCAVKLRYAPDLGVFVYGRELPLGLTYPFDFGFVPGTRAPDGDPVDVLVVSDAPGYPGVVIPARLFGVLAVEQDGEGGGRERNDRIVAVPVASARWSAILEPSKLPERLRSEIEQFFLSVTFFTEKHARTLGWSGASAAEQLVARCAV